MTNLEIALDRLGWSGGTIHQVARHTHLTIEQILTADQGTLCNLIDDAIHEIEQDENENIENNRIGL